jgi:hypothetical protein
MINRLIRKCFGVCAFLSFLTSLTFAADIYHGKVIDEETGEPLAGASVTVIWYKTPIVQFEGSLYFQSAQETLTDAEGKFSLEAAPGVDWNPFTTIVKKPRLVIYQPRYWPFHPGRMPKEYWDDAYLAEAFKNGVTIKMARVKTEAEMRDIASLSAIGASNVPYDQIPNLLQNVNSQIKFAGIKSYYK